MEPGPILCAALFGYLCGSISFSRIISRLVNPKADIDHVEFPIEGSDEKFPMEAMGATTAAMVLGPKVGCTIGLLDMLKAFIPTLIVRLLWPEQTYFLLTAIMAMVGHNWPVFHRFQGGRGISAAYGGLFAVDWLGAIVTSSVGMLVGMAVFKDMVISYLGGLWLIIPWMWLTTFSLPHIGYAIALNILFTIAMIPEIRKIIEFRRKLGTKGSLEGMMTITPMGRMMMKLGQKLRLMK
jgi:glycerol-3-phosphate acyltransferase PlsY